MISVSTISSILGETCHRNFDPALRTPCLSPDVDAREHDDCRASAHYVMPMREDIFRSIDRRFSLILMYVASYLPRTVLKLNNPTAFAESRS